MEYKAILRTKLRLKPDISKNHELRSKKLK
jgi:hypothetical protein